MFRKLSGPKWRSTKSTPGSVFVEILAQNFELLARFDLFPRIGCRRMHLVVAVIIVAVVIIVQVDDFNVLVADGLLGSIV
jgi:hypothetical protein